jgi:hypothetical protein
MAGNAQVFGTAAGQVKAFSKSYDPKTWVDPNEPPAVGADPRPRPRRAGWLGYVLSALLLAAGAAGAYASRADGPIASS